MSLETFEKGKLYFTKSGRVVKYIENTGHYLFPLKFELQVKYGKDVITTMQDGRASAYNESPNSVTFKECKEPPKWEVLEEPESQDEYCECCGQSI